MNKIVELIREDVVRRLDLLPTEEEEAKFDDKTQYGIRVERSTLKTTLTKIDSLAAKDKDEEYSFSGKFSGLCPAWINAPSTLQPAHKYHGKNVVAIHEKTGGFRCCCIDDEVPSTFHVPENTELVPGWTGRKSKKDDA